MLLLFLSSGLFLGWSLGANDAANIFGTAVSTKMVRFRVAAYTAGFFVVLGAVFGGAGATRTLGQLGSVNAIAGAFMVAFSAGFTVFLMTKYRLPVSTSQAIVGSIIGWNLYAGMLTDGDSLTKIVMTWVLCPLLAAAIAMILYILTKWARTRVKISLFNEDRRTRMALLLIGAFGAYSLGANNIANVIGVFAFVKIFDPLNVLGLFTLNSTQILFLVGGLSIAVGIITYSSKVMDTVGANIINLSPVTAFIAVLAESIVLFVFSSQGLESWLIRNGLPAIPLVPVSSSQAVVGAVIGIGLVRNFRQIRFKVLGEIATGWITTPVIAGLITFIFLFFLQNVFNQKVYQNVNYLVSGEVIDMLEKDGIKREWTETYRGKEFNSEISFYQTLMKDFNDKDDLVLKIINKAKISPITVSEEILLTGIDREYLSTEQFYALEKLSGQQFQYKWQFDQALQKTSPAWQYKATNIGNRTYNQNLKAQYEYLYRTFAAASQGF
jgi:PiT family inorganic phosphate transporter